MIAFPVSDLTLDCMAEITAINSERWLWAEYCPGPFYMGWWLYERDRTDRSRNDDGDWGWLRDFYHLRPVYELLVAAGRVDAPEVRNHPHVCSQKLAEWFAKEYPQGLRVRVTEGGYELAAV